MRALSLSRKKFLRHERLAKHEKRSYLENQEGRQVLLTLTAPADSESLSKPSFRLMYQPESCPGSVPALPGPLYICLCQIASIDCGITPFSRTGWHFYRNTLYKISKSSPRQCAISVPIERLPFSISETWCCLILSRSANWACVRPSRAHSPCKLCCQPYPSSLLADGAFFWHSCKFRRGIDLYL